MYFSLYKKLIKKRICLYINFNEYCPRMGCQTTINDEMQTYPTRCHLVPCAPSISSDTHGFYYPRDNSKSFINIAGTLKVHSIGFGWACSCETNATIMGAFNALSEGKFRIYKGSKMAISCIPVFFLSHNFFLLAYHYFGPVTVFFIYPSLI
jgi:hypothetical protein